MFNEKNKMERLLKLSGRKYRIALPPFKRYLFLQIEWNQRLILILGHRGTGKTTLMLQKMQEYKEEETFYLSLDDYVFEESRLATVIEDLFEKGYKKFFLDEAHRYANWSTDLKIIYDQYPEASFVVSGSSILKLSKGMADLSRRAATYHLAGLSLREFIALEKGISMPTLEFADILTNSVELSDQITDKIDILPLFREYLEYGYYPFYQESKLQYKSRLIEITNLVLEMDIAPFEELTHHTIRTMKKMIFIIAESVPFIPNISKLAERLEVSRNTILKILDLLEQARILNLLRKSTQGVSFLQKPEKIYLHNGNLAFALSSNNSNKGNIRESFFLNQVQVNHEVTFPKYGDFMVDQVYIFELGGPGKTAHKINGVPNAFIVADEIKSGSKNKIPLWLFGFLY